MYQKTSGTISKKTVYLLINKPYIMKKLLFQILFLLLIVPAFSQGFVTVQGTVTDLANGSPIQNHAVTILSDSTSGFVYYVVVNTNASGFFVDTIPVTLGTTGTLYIETLDCNNIMHQDVWNFIPYQTHTSTFSICNTNTGGCVAAFTYSVGTNNTVQFSDLSSGTPSVVAWSWNFGDPASGLNNSSSLQNPVHIFTLPGVYNVCLTIQGAAGCTSTTCLTLQIPNGGSCNAQFTEYADTTTSPNSIQFIDQSTAGTGNILHWTWNFGDGSVQTVSFPANPNVSHTYATNGTFTVCLSIQGSDSTCQDMACSTVVIGSGGGCHAQFTYYADSTGTAGTIHFIDQSTSSNNITMWIWNFGDGTMQTITPPASPDVTHTYLGSALAHMACLAIYSDSLCYDQICDTIFTGVSNTCLANFTWTDSINVTNPTQFIDLSQAAGGGPITSWSWNFGDGTTSTVQNPIHLFASPGTYTVCLTIHGADSSCYDNTCKTVVISATTGCQANFTYTCTAPTFMAVQFNDLSTGNPTAWLWNFGNGTSSSIQNPLYVFPAPGYYTVCLTISGNNCTSTFCQNVIVQDSTNYHQVYGQVFAGNFPVSQGMAMIFSFDTTSAYQPYVATSPLDSNGVYYFTAVPSGNYYILALPFDSNGFLPTYYGNVINWQQATLITLGNPSNPYNINLVPSGQMTGGPGSTSGQINMGDVSSALLDKINMILMNSLGQPIGFAKVTTAGAFNFSTLAYGTYYLHPEMPGVTSDNIMIVISAAKPHVDVVMTFTGKNIQGIHDVASQVSQWTVYPNPVTDHVSVSIDMKQGMTVTAEIFNLAGQVLSTREIVLQGGNNLINISTSGLPEGLYTLQLFSKDGVNIHAKMIKTR